MVIYICFFKGATEDIIPKMGMLFVLQINCMSAHCLITCLFPLSGNIAKHEAL